MLVFLECMFSCTGFKQRDRQNFMDKSVTIIGYFNFSCRGSIDNACTLHVRGAGFDPRRQKLFIENFFWSFCLFGFFFRKKYFHFLPDLKCTRRLIAGSLSASAFISKMQSEKLALGTLSLEHIREKYIQQTYSPNSMLYPIQTLWE